MRPVPEPLGAPSPLRTRAAARGVLPVGPGDPLPLPSARRSAFQSPASSVPPWGPVCGIWDTSLHVAGREDLVTVPRGLSFCDTQRHCEQVMQAHLTDGLCGARGDALKRLSLSTAGCRALSSCGDPGRTRAHRGPERGRRGSESHSRHGPGRGSVHCGLPWSLSRVLCYDAMCFFK